MFVNTLSQKTIEALDSDARALLRKPVTAAGTWFSFSSLDGRDPETLSRLICSAAANAAAAVFLIYDDAQAYIRAEPADSVSGVCLVEGESVGTYLADYFDLTPAEAEDVNAFFAKD